MWGGGAGSTEDVTHGEAEGGMFRSSNCFARQEADDTEELQKAALEKLKAHPHGSRMAVLPLGSKKIDMELIDVRRLNKQARQNVLRRAMEVDDQDNEKLLSKIKQRQDRAGIERSKIEVRFQNVTVDAKVRVGSAGLPNFKNAAIGFLEYFTKFLGIRTTKSSQIKILKGVSGVLRPGRMCLLLAPPGSGKSTLLKVLSGKIQNGGLLKIGGNITYNGRTFKDFVIERTSGYVQQNDQHYAPLTVKETLAFAAWCQGGGYRVDELTELRQREQELGIAPDPAVDAYMKANAQSDQKNKIIVDLVVKLLGLDVCMDTIVGDQLLRGISGGQKKRVTSGEMLVGGKKAMFLDEISTGLDSATTFLIIKCLSNFCHFLEGTLLVALLQPPPETYHLFDDVMLLSSGRLMYSGPRSEVMNFFNGLGLQCPEDKGVADFLQDVTLPADQAAYRADKSSLFLTPLVIERAFMKSKWGQALESELAQPFQGSERQMRSLVTTKYGLPWHQAFKACMGREWRLFYRNSFAFYSSTFQICYLSFLSATAFLHPSKSSQEGANLFLLEIFFTALIAIFAGFGKIPETVLGLSNFYKQRSNRFFPAWCFVLPKALFDIPFAIWQTTLWVCIHYFAVGFSKNAGRFWLHWLILFLTNTASCALFRGCAALGRDPIIASTAGVLAIFTVVFSGGIMIARQTIRWWWRWLYYISPVAFSVRSLAVNEFSAPEWQIPFQSDPSITLEDASLVYFGIQTDYFWMWLGILVLFGYTIVFNGITVWAYTFLSYPQSPPILPEAKLASLQEADEETGAPSEQNTAPPPTSDGATGMAAEGADPAMGHQQQNGGIDDATGRASYGGSKHQGEVELAKKVDMEGSISTSEDNKFDEAGGMVPAGRSRSVRAHPVEGSADSDFDVGVPGQAVRPSQRNISSRNMTNSQKVVKEGGLLLPFQAVVLTFKDVNYFVPMPGAKSKGLLGKKQELQLLKNISGVFRPKVLTALMGASGAGKTTLMDVLADRKTGGRTTGEQRMNGDPKRRASLARVMGYVEQTDIHSPSATVFEALLFSATLRLERNVNERTKRAFAENVLALVDLTPLRDSLVGLPGISGLSVEQRKRLTIAVELVANPSIVFMDEPTSGLDARSAGTVMRAVKNTVRTGRTVVCTIHQPNWQIFSAFDELLLLQRGGTTIYAGPLGRDSNTLIDYFEALGVEPKPEGLNPATWMLEISTPAAEERTDVSFTKVYNESGLRRQLDQQVQELALPSEKFPRIVFKTVYARRRYYQYTVLLKKFSITYWRTPNYTWVRFLITMILGFVLGTLYWKLGHHTNDQIGVQNTIGAINAVTIFLGALYSLNVLPVASVERAVFYRERAAYLYAAGPWSLAQVTVEIPFLIVQGILYTMIVYWCTGQSANAAKFFAFCLFLILNLDIFTNLGICVTNLTPSLQIATTMLTTIIATWNVLSGFYIPKPYLAHEGWWYWALYANPLTFVTWGLVANQLGDRSDVVFVQTDGTPTNLADYIQTSLGFRHDFWGWCIGVVVLYALAFRVFNALALKFLNFQSR